MKVEYAGKCVMAILTNKDRVLLHLRDNKNGLPQRGTWSFFGGVIEKEEHPFIALKRELKEEMRVPGSIDEMLANATYLGTHKIRTGQELHAYTAICPYENYQVEVLEGQCALYFTKPKIYEANNKVAYFVKDMIKKWEAEIFR